MKSACVHYPMGIGCRGEIARALSDKDHRPRLTDSELHDVVPKDDRTHRPSHHYRALATECVNKVVYVSRVRLDSMAGCGLLRTSVPAKVESHNTMILRECLNISIPPSETARPPV